MKRYELSIVLLRRLVTDVTDPQLAGALAATDFRAQRGQAGQSGLGKVAPVQARRLAQTAQPQLGVSNVSTDISCDGCSGTDTRTEVREHMILKLRGHGKAMMSLIKVMVPCTSSSSA